MTCVSNWRSGSWIVAEFTVSSTILAVAHRSFDVHNALSIVFLPEMFKRLAFMGKCLIDSFYIEIPIQLVRLFRLALSGDYALHCPPNTALASV